MTICITPVDRKAANNGKWTKYRGVDLCIARSNNTKFKSYFRKLTAPYQTDMDEGRMSEEVSIDIMAQALGKEVLVDWKNFVINGEEIPYSPSNSKELLLNDPDCQDFVMSFSEKVTNYFTDQKEIVSGES